MELISQWTDLESQGIRPQNSEALKLVGSQHQRNRSKIPARKQLQSNNKHG